MVNIDLYKYRITIFEQLIYKITTNLFFKRIRIFSKGKGEIKDSAFKIFIKIYVLYYFLFLYNFSVPFL